LAEALEYLSMGFSIIPLAPGVKTPALKSWEVYKTRKPTKEEVERWFKGTDNNIAIITGEVSKVVVVDCDSPEALDYVMKNFPSHQRTVTRKGLHHWFKHPGGKVKNSVNLHGIKIDIRGDGGYVVAPGSRHPSGFTYGREGVWGPVSTLPEFPAEILGGSSKATGVDTAIQNELDLAGVAVEGDGGNPKTFNLCCRLIRGFALSEDECLEKLRPWNEKNLPPFSEKELRVLLKQALLTGTEPMGARAEVATQEWRAELLTDKKGRLLRFRKNIDIILDNDARFKGALTMDERDMQVFWKGREITDDFAHTFASFFEAHWGLAFTKGDLEAAAIACASRNSFNMLRDMIHNFPAWDGVPRIGRVLTEIIGSPGNALHEAMIRCFFIGAIRRPLHPGEKVDTALVLVGPQGSGKSTFFRVLGAPFFDDTRFELESKDRFLALRKAWIIELAELDGMTSTKMAQHIKGLLSSTIDTFRPPYGRAIINAPRTCILVGTTNTEAFLTDPTGSRRFWPIPVSKPINLGLLREWREQLFAEARELEAAGENHWLDASMEEVRVDSEDTYTAQDPWKEMIFKAFRRLSNSGTVLMDGITVGDLFDAMEVPVNMRNRGADMRVATLLKTMGWEGYRRRVDGQQVRVWVPTATTKLPETSDAPSY
jgi:predicted P-loop ATPase